MHICHIRIYSVAVPRVYHTRVAPTGGHSKNASRYYLLELETNTGLRGLGEISDLEDAWQAPSPETLCETLTPLLAGADPRKTPPRLGARRRGVARQRPPGIPPTRQCRRGKWP